MTEPSIASLNEALIRLESKIDVVLTQHQARLDEIDRRQAEHQSQLREHSALINQNGLALVQHGQQLTGLATDLAAAKESARRYLGEFRTEVAQDIAEARPKNVAAWAGVVVSMIAVVVAIVTVVSLHG